MGSITIVNVRGVVPTDKIYYVGREWGGWKASCLGNPFRVRRYGHNLAIAKYRELFYRWMGDKNSPQRREIQRLCAWVDSGHDLVLGCWCAPEPCHADIIKECILKTIQRKREKDSNS